MKPEDVQKVIRDRGWCGELSPDRKSVCILPANEPHQHDWIEPDCRKPDPEDQ